QLTSGPFTPFVVPIRGPRDAWREILEGSAPVAVANAQRLGQSPSRALFTIPGWRSGLVIPLRAAREILGLLGMGYLSAYSASDAADRELAAALGAAVAHALAGIRLQRAASQDRLRIRQLETSNRMLTRYAGELAVLHAAARSLS